MIRSAVAATIAAAAFVAATAPAEASVEPFAWPHHAHRWPVVQVEDHTGNAPAWAVRNAVKAWGSGLRYGTCHPGAGCIRITDTRQGANGWVGTAWHYTTGRRLDYVRIDLNDTYRALGLAVTRQATLHELGHGLGLGHDPRGVMRSLDLGGARITRHERAELHRIYGVRG